MVRTVFSLPFTVTSYDVSSYQGGEHINKSAYRDLPISGLLRIEAKTLCFQFRRKVSTSPVAWIRKEHVKNLPDIEDVCVPLEHVRGATLKRSRWFTSRLTLHANDLRAFEQIPGGMGIRIVLRITKEHADLAESFVGRLHLKLSEQTLRHLDDDLETAE